MTSILDIYGKIKGIENLLMQLCNLYLWLSVIEINRKHMKSTYLTLAFVFGIAFSSVAQNSETRSVGSFEGVSASASVNVTLVKGNKNEVAITAKGVELDEVKTEVDDDILYVGMYKNNNGWSWKSGKKKEVNVIVTYTDDPRYLSVSSSADLMSKEVIRADKMKISASSSGDMVVEVRAGEIEISASSSADIDISGEAQKAMIKASSSADILGKNLKTQKAKISASSSADVEIAVSESIQARASSGADINYYGNPSNKDISRSSGGDVEREH